MEIRDVVAMGKEMPLQGQCCCCTERVVAVSAAAAFGSSASIPSLSSCSSNPLLVKATSD